MSYCRWSSDDHQCDVYVWADVAGGYRTEVAVRRRQFRAEVSMPPPVVFPVGEAGSSERTEWASETSRRMSAVSAMLDDENEGVLWDWVDVPSPTGVTSFWDDSPGETAERLEVLRECGVNVPQYAIDSLRAEVSGGAR